MTVMTEKEDSMVAIANSVEAKFAQRLAANEKKIRDRAFKKLRQFLMARSAKSNGGFSRDEMIRIWKGIFYCMWMSDKPLIQEELARGIAKLLSELKNIKASIMYLETFLATMGREWMGIDRLRMDKFLLLCRFMLQNSFVLIKNNGWDEGVIEWVMGVLRNGPLIPVAPGPSATCGPPLGLRFHIIEIYMEELSSCADENLTPDKSELLLKPFVSLCCKTTVLELRNKSMEKVFQEIVDQSEPAQELFNEVNPEEAEEVVKPAVGVNYTSLADLMFDAANEETTLTRNRKKVYAMVKKLRSLAEGQVPLDDLPDILPDENIDPEEQEKDFMGKLANELEKEYDTMKSEKETFKKKRKKFPHFVDDGFYEGFPTEPMPQEVSEDLPVDETSTETRDTIAIDKKKSKKKKTKKLSQTVSEDNTDSLGENNNMGVLLGSALEAGDFPGDSSSSDLDTTVTQLQKPKSAKKKKRTNVGVCDEKTQQEDMDELFVDASAAKTVKSAQKTMKKRKTTAGKAMSTKKQKLLEKLTENEDSPKENEPIENAEPDLQSDVKSKITPKIQEDNKKSRTLSATKSVMVESKVSEMDSKVVNEVQSETEADFKKTPHTRNSSAKKSTTKKKGKGKKLETSLANEGENDLENDQDNIVETANIRSKKSKKGKKEKEISEITSESLENAAEENNEKVIISSNEKKLPKNKNNKKESTINSANSDENQKEENPVKTTISSAKKSKKSKKPKQVDSACETDADCDAIKIGATSEDKKTSRGSQERSRDDDFASFTPKPLPTSSFLRVAASKVERQKSKRKSSSHSVSHSFSSGGAKRKSLSALAPSDGPKHVTFQMAKTQVQAFRKTDKSIVLSPSPSSVAFDPQKTPDFGVLKPKRPTQGTNTLPRVKKRKTASDFF